MWRQLFVKELIVLSSLFSTANQNPFPLLTRALTAEISLLTYSSDFFARKISNFWAENRQLRLPTQIKQVSHNRSEVKIVALPPVDISTYCGTKKSARNYGSFRKNATKQTPELKTS